MWARNALLGFCSLHEIRSWELGSVGVARSLEHTHKCRHTAHAHAHMLTHACRHGHSTDTYAHEHMHACAQHRHTHACTQRAHKHACTHARSADACSQCTHANAHTCIDTRMPAARAETGMHTVHTCECTQRTCTHMHAHAAHTNAPSTRTHTHADTQCTHTHTHTHTHPAQTHSLPLNAKAAPGSAGGELTGPKGLREQRLPPRYFFWGHAVFLAAVLTSSLSRRKGL